MPFAWIARTIRSALIWFLHGCLSAIAWVMVKTLSPRRAFKGAVWFARWIYPLAGGVYDYVQPQLMRRDRRGIILNWMFGVMTRHGRIEMDVRVENFALIERYHAKFGRLILCTAHFGLTMSLFSVLERNRFKFNTISGGNGYGWNWGCREPLSIIPKDHRCLMRLKRTLHDGVIAVVYADRMPNREGQRDVIISDHIFHFARITKTPILYYDAEFTRNGTIQINIIEPRTADAIEFGQFAAARTGWDYIVEQTQ